jgi:hypothetical protein
MGFIDERLAEKGSGKVPDRFRNLSGTPRIPFERF